MSKHHDSLYQKAFEADTYLKMMKQRYLLALMVLSTFSVYFLTRSTPETLFYFVAVSLFIPMFYYDFERLYKVYAFVFFGYMFVVDLQWVGVVYLLLGVAFAVQTQNKHDTYKQDYYDLVIEPLLKSYDKSFKFDAQKHVHKRFFKDSWVFNISRFKLEGDNRVKGKYLDVKFEISNANAYTTYRDEDGDTQKNDDLYKGLSMGCTFNKDLTYRTLVFPDKYEKKYGTFIGNLLQKRKYSRLKLIKMDYPEFEKAFVIYGEDEIETRYVLNHNLMKNILSLQKNLGTNEFFMAFYLCNFVLFSDLSYSFSAPLASELNNFSHLKDTFKRLDNFVSIIETLKLNERLWTK